MADARPTTDAAPRVARRRLRPYGVQAATVRGRTIWPYNQTIEITYSQTIEITDTPITTAQALAHLMLGGAIVVAKRGPRGGWKGASYLCLDSARPLDRQEADATRLMEQWQRRQDTYLYIGRRVDT